MLSTTMVKIIDQSIFMTNRKAHKLHVTGWPMTLLRFVWCPGPESNRYSHSRPADFTYHYSFCYRTPILEGKLLWCRTFVVWTIPLPYA